MAENEGLDQSLVMGSASQQPESAPQAQSTPAEKLLPQSHVNDIVGREKSFAHEKGYEKGKREALEEFQRNQSAVTTPSAVSSGAAMTEGEYRRLAAEEAQKVQMAKEQENRRNSDEEKVQQFVQQFAQKCDAGRRKYSDFDAALGSIDLANAGNVVVLAQSLENTADVMYELAKNRPQDLVAIEQLAVQHPRKAREVMMRLSESIKVNQTGAAMKRPNEPLSQISPSNTGIDNGSEHNMSTADFRKMRY